MCVCDRPLPFSLFRVPQPSSAISPSITADALPSPFRRPGGLIKDGALSEEQILKFFKSFDVCMQPPPFRPFPQLRPLAHAFFPSRPRYSSTTSFISPTLSCTNSSVI